MLVRISRQSERILIGCVASSILLDRNTKGKLIQKLIEHIKEKTPKTLAFGVFWRA